MRVEAGRSFEGIIKMSGDQVFDNQDFTLIKLGTDHGHLNPLIILLEKPCQQQPADLGTEPYNKAV